jgi:hypothetical protein
MKQTATKTPQETPAMRVKNAQFALRLIHGFREIVTIGKL